MEEEGCWLAIFKLIQSFKHAKQSSTNLGGLNEDERRRELSLRV